VFGFDFESVVAAFGGVVVAVFVCSGVWDEGAVGDCC